LDYTAFLTPTLGVGGIVLLAVVMLLRGDLVSRRQVDTLLAVKDAQIAFLEKTNGDLSAALGKRDDQLAEMMVTARTTRRVVESLPEAVGLGAGGDGHVPT
jgi:hypothetical protein